MKPTLRCHSTRTAANVHLGGENARNHLLKQRTECMHACMECMRLRTWTLLLVPHGPLAQACSLASPLSFAVAVAHPSSELALPAVSRLSRHAEQHPHHQQQQDDAEQERVEGHV